MTLHLTHIIDQLVSSLNLVKSGGNRADRKAAEPVESKQFATALKAASTPAPKKDNSSPPKNNTVKETLPNPSTQEVQNSQSQSATAAHSSDSVSEKISDEKGIAKGIAENERDTQDNDSDSEGVELLTPPLLAFLNILPQAEEKPELPAEVSTSDQLNFDSSVSDISTSPVSTDIKADTQNLVQALSEFLSTQERPEPNLTDAKLPGISGQVSLNSELKTALGSSLSSEDIAAIEARVRQKLADATQASQPQISYPSYPEVAAKPEQETSLQNTQPQAIQLFTELAQRLVAQNETGDKGKVSVATNASELAEKPALTLNTALKAAPIIQGILQHETKIVSLSERLSHTQPVNAPANPYILQQSNRFSNPVTLPVSLEEPVENTLNSFTDNVNSKLNSTLTPDKLDTHAETFDLDIPGAFSSGEFSLDATIATGQLGAQSLGGHSLTPSTGVSADQGIQTPASSAPVNWTHDSVVDQVQDKISQFQVNSARKEISFNLTPDDLGTVRVHLNSTNNHQLSARFIVTSVEAQSALENNVHQLKQSLEQQGVRVDQVSIVLAGASEAKVSHGNNASNQQDFSGNQQQESAQEQARDFDRRNQQNQARQELAALFQENLSRGGIQDIQYNVPSDNLTLI